MELHSEMSGSCARRRCSRQAPYFNMAGSGRAQCLASAAAVAPVVSTSSTMATRRLSQGLGL